MTGKFLIPDAAFQQNAIALGNFGRGPRTITPSATDIAYAAGFFDGEGNITIAVNKAHPRTGRHVYNMRCGASQNIPAPLFWLRDRWGGSVQPMRRKTGHAEGYVWNCFSRQAATFLNVVLPYLQVKKARADLAIAFQASVFQSGRNGHDDAYYEKLADFREQVAQLNGKKPLLREQRI